MHGHLQGHASGHAQDASLADALGILDRGAARVLAEHGTANFLAPTAEGYLNGTLLLNLSSTLSGLLVAGLFLLRGSKRETYGLWDKYVK